MHLRVAQVGITSSSVFSATAALQNKGNFRFFSSYLLYKGSFTIDKKKKINFVIFKKKKKNLTIDPLSLGTYAQGPQVLTYRPQILRGVRI